MVANREYILKLIKKNNWTQTEFAKKIGISRTSVSRWVKGDRGAGRTFISGIIRTFPDEPLDKLFFMDKCC